MTRCEIVQRYDANSDGMIDMDEAFKGIDDLNTGDLTGEEFGHVRDAYVLGDGGVAQMCPSTPCAGTIIIAAVIGLAILCALVG